MPHTAITTLYLVNPAGGRYAITTFPPSDGGARPKLVDWSGDSGHALLYATNATRPSVAVTVDLHSGTQTTFPVNNGFDVVARYTRPEGTGVLLAKWRDTEPAWLQRVDLSGHHELSYPVAPDFQGSYLSTPDGAQLVLGAASGLALMGNDGVARKALPIARENLCEPTRWWDTGSTIVVTRCSDNGLSRLWLVPIDGGPPTALTAPLSGQGSDYGDTNAWQLPAGTFVQDAGACGYEYLAKLSAVGGTTAAVSVPDVNPGSSVRVIGFNAGHLDLQATGACGGGGQSLFDYDPAAGTSATLLGPPVNGGGVIDAVPYPGQR